jgi:toxin ParE1/3/4
VSRYRLSFEAQCDLDEIRSYLIKEGGTRLVRHVNAELRKTFNFLTESPGAGHFREDLTDEPVRFLSVFSYLIVYDPALRPLGIVRVLHGAQDLAALFRKTPPAM